MKKAFQDTMKILFLVLQPTKNINLNQDYVGIGGMFCNLIERRKINAMTKKEFNFNALGRMLLKSDNLCDGSIYSEAYSIHVLTSIFNRCGLTIDLFKTETDIGYFFDNCKKMDYVINVSNENFVNRLGVEVKRIMDFNGLVVLNKNYVFGVLDNANSKAFESNRNVLESDRWDAQILHILTNNEIVIQYIDLWISSRQKIGYISIFTTIIIGNSNIIY